MKIRGTQKLTDLKYLNLMQVDYTDRNDREKSWVYATRGSAARPDAVVVAPFHTERNKLVLIREFRLPIRDYQYGFPAGLVDPGETPVRAGERELMEETGLVLTRVLAESPPIFSSTGMTDESICMLYAECKGAPSTDFNEGSEEIEVVLADQALAKQLVIRDDLNFDVKTWIVLERFAATGTII